MSDADFLGNEEGLKRSLEMLLQTHAQSGAQPLPADLPDTGLGASAALELLAPLVLGGAAHLGAASSLAHMDPPTPWITWATTLWNASLNQNLLHPATAPVARRIEEAVVNWLAPYFGMSGGHITPGSTLANLTALWAARECAGIDEVVASDSAHLSIAKAAHILGLRFRQVATDATGAMLADQVPTDLSRAALVLTAGTTSTGVIDPLHLASEAAWAHVDAAWAGPLRLTRYRTLLNGIERANSVAVSAHKWLFQPKESALILFRDNAEASAAISFGGAYLAVPNVGILGSHGATAVPLLATLLAWGRQGLAERIERCVEISDSLAGFIKNDARLQLLAEPQSGVVVWRPARQDRFDDLLAALPPGMVSTTTIKGERWLRNVAANPNADVTTLLENLATALEMCLN
ncbi:aspartate aminotransferase family protein [Roseateles aquatilis]|jgi:L-2,4-diaminobutyrate decarboxylase|uniref:Aspartate aminotransferase family protein n=1 Tax=Roseateles aquatilis TaxID=431061 RepID=A0A246JEB7_9BURK|nr:pyridoxal-dependent decarboxylase [Roseateles aquatilis]MBY0366333.1 aspartate aminotransferase family protein [Burkholderiaceae bacterium]OWQ90939.1 aspartate aminotransferase family protein [Roseateles aquatilis]